MACFKAFDEDQAIDPAIDCFWARGYAATSVRDLADTWASSARTSTTPLDLPDFPKTTPKKGFR
jgi:hypothetical protein